MSRVLVTGGSGFIGRHAVRALAQANWEVHVVQRSAQTSDDSGTQTHQADLLDNGVAEDLIGTVKPTHLLHLAWVTKHGEFWNSPENLRWVAHSLELLRAFVEHGGKRAVLAGSCAEYKWRSGACHEDRTPLEPNTLYGLSKLSLFRLSERYAALKDVELLWGRIFHVYGPAENPARLVPDIMNNLLGESLRFAELPTTCGI